MCKNPGPMHSLLSISCGFHGVSYSCRRLQYLFILICDCVKSDNCCIVDSVLYYYDIHQIVVNHLSSCWLISCLTSYDVFVTLVFLIPQWFDGWTTSRHRFKTHC